MWYYIMPVGVVREEHRWALNTPWGCVSQIVILFGTYKTYA